MLQHKNNPHIKSGDEYTKAKQNFHSSPPLITAANNSTITEKTARTKIDVLYMDESEELMHAIAMRIKRDPAATIPGTSIVMFLANADVMSPRH